MRILRFVLPVVLSTLGLGILSCTGKDAFRKSDFSRLVNSGTGAGPWCLFKVKAALLEAPPVELPEQTIWVPVPGQSPNIYRSDSQPKSWSENLVFRITHSADQLVTVRVASRYLQVGKDIDLTGVRKDLCQVMVPAGQYLLVLGDAGLYQGVYTVECSSGSTTVSKDIILIRGDLP